MLLSVYYWHLIAFGNFGNVIVVLDGIGCRGSPLVLWRPFGSVCWKPWKSVEVRGGLLALLKLLEALEVRGRPWMSVEAHWKTSLGRQAVGPPPTLRLFLRFFEFLSIIN